MDVDRRIANAQKRVREKIDFLGYSASFALDDLRKAHEAALDKLVSWHLRSLGQLRRYRNARG